MDPITHSVGLETSHNSVFINYCFCFISNKSNNNHSHVGGDYGAMKAPVASAKVNAGGRGPIGGVPSSARSGAMPGCGSCS